MRVLLDNCVPWQLMRSLAGHTVESVIKLGWADLLDGEPLPLVEGRFDALLTVDTSIPFQQNLSKYSFGVIVMRARSNRLHDLILLAPEVLTALQSLAPGTAVVVGGV